MEIISGKTQFHIKENSAVAIGKFDGIHIGHQKLLKELLNRKNLGEKTVVFTFEPSPAKYLAKKQGLLFQEKEITTRDEKRKLFEAFGIDVLIEFPMNDDTVVIEPEDFVKTYLLDFLHVKFVAAGADLSFGNRGSGDTRLLCEMGKLYGFQVDIIDKVCYKGTEISSTFVRECLERGETDKIPELLGRYYSFTGIIQHGHKIGRTIGMPTVNLIPEEEKLIPTFGVYYSKVMLDDKEYYGITNIGKKPTIGDHEMTGVETYIYDFNQDLYGREITVYLLQYKRPELRFSSKEALQIQMQQDMEEGRVYHQI